MTQATLTRRDIAQIARNAHLDVVGITDAAPFPEVRDFLVDHVEHGHTRGMDWFTTQRAREASDPRTLHDNVQSIISVGLPFWSGKVECPDDGVLRGRIARYAWGRDYHKTLKRRMQDMVQQITAEVGHPVEDRTLTDTARIVDRAVAARAGTGWYGKNTMIIVPGRGSWVMLGEILLDIHLPPDVPLNWNCGRCTLCIDHCPTGAIIEPYRVHAPRCISFLTIEERGPIPHELRPLMGNYVFGCDICQNVCPYTTAAKPIDDADFRPRTIDNAFPSLEMLATMSQDAFYDVYAGTPVTRAKRAGMARNAAIALGNSGDARAEAILETMLLKHDEPLAREHAAWALGHLTQGAARATLLRARSTESDPSVLEEIDLALLA